MLFLLIVGFFISQTINAEPSQDFLNATFTQRFIDVERRLTNIEGKGDYILMTVFGSLLAHGYQILSQSKKRN